MRRWPADTAAPSLQPHTNMDLLMGVLFVSLGTGTFAHINHEPLKERGSRSMYRHFEDEFEPYAFAAVPLHHSFPIIRVLSPSPKYKFGMPFDDMESFNYFSQPTYSASVIEPLVTEPSESSSEQQFDVIYARPNKKGGYTYRKQAASPRPARPRPLRSHPPPEPVILRVHKYKVVRNR